MVAGAVLVGTDTLKVVRAAAWSADIGEQFSQPVRDGRGETASAWEVTMFDELFPILSTPDMARALGFYRDLLGGQVTYQFPPDGDPGYVAVKIGTSHLGIGLQDQSGVAVNDRITLWVYAQDCDAALVRLRDGGVQVVQEPADQPWGERMATVVDPDGNRVIVASQAAGSGPAL
jgi:lactoylglutathione lyase